jgi:AsmA protein
LLDGAIRGYDLQATLIKLQELYKGETATDESRPDVKTKFAELGADFDVSKGVFVTDNMAMKAPAFRVAGRGSMDLPEEKLDYVLEVSVVNTVEGQGGESLEHLEGVTIPLKVYGALDAPSFSLDLAGLLKARAKKEIEKKLLEELGAGAAVEGAEQPEPKDLLKARVLEELGVKKEAKEPAAEDEPAPAGDSTESVLEGKQEVETKEEADPEELLKEKLLEKLGVEKDADRAAEEPAPTTSKSDGEQAAPAKKADPEDVLKEELKKSLFEKLGL